MAASSRRSRARSRRWTRWRELYRVDGWKLYPQYGANGRGIFLDRSDDANRFFEAARGLGVQTVAVHKGVPLPGLEYEYSSPRDMGPAAIANPDLNFLVYHGGFEGGNAEGPYDPDNPQRRRPVDQVARGGGPHAATRAISTPKWDRCGAIS